MPRGRSPPHRIAKPPCARCSWWAAGGPGGKVGQWALIPWLLWPQCMACFCLKGGRRELGGRKVHSEAQPAAGPAHGLGPTEQRPASAPPPRAAGGAPQVTETRRPNHRGAGSSCPPRSRTGAGTAAGGGRTAASACLRGFAESPPLHLPQISHQIPQAGPHPEQLGGLARLGHLLARATSLRLCPPGLGSPASAPAPPAAALRESRASSAALCPLPVPPWEPRPRCPAAHFWCQAWAGPRFFSRGPARWRCSRAPLGAKPRHSHPRGHRGLQPHAAPSRPPHSPRLPGEPAGTWARPHLTRRGHLYAFR